MVGNSSEKMVAKATILQDTLYFMKADLTANITDPISSKRSAKSKFIMTSYPQRPVQYPLITIKATNVEALRAGMQTTAQDILITLEIRIWARNEKEKDGLYEDILNRLSAIQFTAGGSTKSELHDLILGSAVEVDEEGASGAQVIKSRVITCSYTFYNVQ